MTKKVKIFIAVMALMLITLLVTAALFIASLSEKNDSELRVFIARREELLAEQQKLKVMVTDLNSTLKKEFEVNQRLSAMLQNITDEKALLDQMAAQNAAASPTQPPAAPQTPTPTPRPIVTRAS